MSDHPASSATTFPETKLPVPHSLLLGDHELTRTCAVGGREPCGQCRRMTAPGPRVRAGTRGRFAPTP